MNFIGRTLALDSAGLAAVANTLNVHAAEVWTVLHVETRGCGFLPDRRPQILFERHIFSKLTGGAFDASNPDISNPQPGGYGASGANQYTRLNEALALNSDAALQSASWGIGQIMGENFSAAGFPDVETMVAAMIDSEDAQLNAFRSFLESAKLSAPLQAHDWASFARGYNGPNYAINHYDTQLNGSFQQFSVGPLPDLAVRAAQLYLTIRGFSPNGIDGILGLHTSGAIIAFQAGADLQQTGNLDEATMSALVPQPPADTGN
ncbi:MAG TPA: N-acetylmuramidase domain-containing protein [Silvibacterium sp.]|nr:N-acetylmuramidase domain-containing protein [Silvibacterium sp.]